MREAAVTVAVRDLLLPLAGAVLFLLLRSVLEQKLFRQDGKIQSRGLSPQKQMLGDDVVQSQRYSLTMYWILF